MEKEFKSSKKLLFEMVEKINHVKPVLKEEFKIMGSYKGREAEELDSAQDMKEAEYLKGEYAMAYGQDFKVWIENEDPETGSINEPMNPIDEKNDKWIQKAVNPEHKGYCTPMSKPTCTPRRKALARRFKKGIEDEAYGVPDPLGTNKAKPLN
jgi:hypothetical protein